jgi:penicillin-binding protein 1A
VENVLDQGIEIEEYKHPDWSKLFYKDQMIHGLVLQSSSANAEVRLGSYSSHISLADMAWTGAKRLIVILQPGDVALFTLRNVNRGERTIEADLDQVPLVQGAVVVLDNRTGAIRAMVGGFDFSLSKFNRATQALRQPGSIFKPFTYIAAMEAGFNPNDRILDQPVQFEDGLGNPYVPTNWDDKFKGMITIAQALAESRNVPTVRLANAIGPEVIAETARRFGLKQNIPPYLSIALGSVEVTLEEIVSAFSSFPNHGVRADPYSIQRVEDSNGVILREHSLSVHDALVSQDVTEKMLYLFQEVIRRGSGRTLLPLGHPLGGKTGTTNEATDVWFVGFTRDLTAGVWIGFDDNTPLGDRVYGSTLALPVWKDFMSEVLKDMTPVEFESVWKPGPYDSSRVVGDLDSMEFMGPVRRQEYQVEDIAPPPGN